MKQLIARPLPRAMLAQLLALVCICALVWLLAQQNLRLPLLGAAFLQGALACAVAWCIRLSHWWLWINLAFVPMLVIALHLQLPGWLYLCGFITLLLVYWNSWREQVPLYFSNQQANHALQHWLSEHTEVSRFVDLGCGTAGPLLQLAARFPQRQFVGVETAPLLFTLAWLRSAPQANCHIYYQNLWQVDLSTFDAAYCFLSPAPMPALWRKAQREMTPGSYLISNTFEIPEAPPCSSIAINHGRQTALHLWQIAHSDIS